LEVNTLMMPMGKDSVMSPVIFTMHLRRPREEEEEDDDDEEDEGGREEEEEPK